MISDRIKMLPLKPGIYIFKDCSGNILYVGKAKSIKNRVGSYFQRSTNHAPRISAMAQKVCDVDCIVTDTEMDALILESNLIKKYRPKYNITLRDDKHYPYLRISIGQPFPEMHVVRQIKKDGAIYFGPYTPSGTLRDMCRELYKVFPLRLSRDILDPGKKRRPCLNYQIGKCLAPCAGYISQYEYQEIVKGVILFLKGHTDKLMDHLFEKMHRASKKLEYEKAAHIRDRIQNIKALMRRQQIVSTSMDNMDVISYYRGQVEKIFIQMMYVRGGKLVGKGNFSITALEDDGRVILSQFIKQYYSLGEYIPEEIVIKDEIEGKGLIEKWLTNLKGSRVGIIVPQRGRKRSLIKMATENAKIYSMQREKGDDTDMILSSLKKDLGMGCTPKHIEAFDISNISGSYAVGSMVCFFNRKMEKSRYRRYKIKVASSNDDYRMIQEIVIRRYARILKENGDLPDLVIIDGGKGHLKAAKMAFEYLHIDKVRVIGLAKGKDRDNPDTDKFFTADSSKGVALCLNQILSKDARLLLSKIRDEAHRFAIKYHRTLRGKSSIRSELDSIEGIGRGLRIALLKHFRSLSAIKNASVNDLMEVNGINKKKAQSIFLYFSNKKVLL